MDNGLLGIRAAIIVLALAAGLPDVPRAHAQGHEPAALGAGVAAGVAGCPGDCNTDLVVRVNELVARQAELLGLLRGTESRVVAEIAALLDPAQQRRFAELRSGAATDGSGVSRATPAEPAAQEARELGI